MITSLMTTKMGQEARLEQDTVQRTLAYDPEDLGSYTSSVTCWLAV